MESNIKILLIGVIILASFSSCNKQKEFKAIGFAYKGDSIILRTEQNKSLNIIVNSNEDKNRICSFYEKMKLHFEKKDTRLSIVIDSNNIKVLDTLVIIPQHFKEPFISFIYPSIETKFTRTFFIADQSDSSFIKE